MTSKHILEEIRSRVSIISVVGDVVSLKRAGRNFKGLCPFHQEKTPSFMVSEEKQIFHCFGCGVGGDIFTFLMKCNGLTFPEALKELAKKAGVQLSAFEKTSPTADKEAARKKSFGFRINEIARDHFVHNLNDKTKGKKALDYLTARGLKKETIAQYSLGLADKEWDGLYKTLAAKKVPLSLAEELGLIRKSQKQEGFYDFFRERILFPIQDAQGNIIGFGGRTITNEDPTPPPVLPAERAFRSERGGEAKYLNSPDSFLYNKSKSAFGLNFAKEAIRKENEVILVEGYMDWLALRQAGVRNVVAPLGTALTLDQLRLFCRYTKNFVVSFDGDIAGRNAAFRVLPLFLELEMTPKALALPKGMDPDSFLQKEGIEGWENLKTNASTLFEYFLSSLIEEEGSDTKAKLNVWEKIRPVLEKVKNPLEAGIYRKRIAEKLGVKEDSLTYGAKAKVPGSARGGPTSGWTFGAPTQKEPGTFFPEEERLLIAAMVLKPTLIPEIQKVQNNFTNPTLKEAAKQLFETYADKGVVVLADCQKEWDENLARWIRELALNQEEEEGIWERTVRDCLKKMEEKNLSSKIQSLNKAIAVAENQGDEKELLKLLGQKTKLLEGRML